MSPTLPAKTQDRIRAPLEPAESPLMDLFAEFASMQGTAAVLLLIASVAGVAFATLEPDLYHDVLHFPMQFRIGDSALDWGLVEWINEGLMALFFFLLGLEIKREVTVGQLREVRRSVVVVACAAGGMLAPAAIYAAINWQGLVYGWGIPIATDTPFAYAALLALGSRVPRPVPVFLVGLAIVDDVGAILAIALFYSAELDTGYLYSALAAWVALGLLNALGVRNALVYGLAAVVLWWLVVQAGVHGTIAGVAAAIMAPVRPKVQPHSFVKRAVARLGHFQAREKEQQGTDVFEDDVQDEAAQDLLVAAERVTSPLRRWERVLDRPVSFGILPLFAFMNAGIDLHALDLAGMVHEPMAWGVFAGLVVGKPLGITLAGGLGLWLGLWRLPEGMTLHHLLGVGCLAGIGFTMSIFVAQLSFGAADLLATAKAAIVIASLVACGLGMAVLVSPYSASPPRSG
ncbi:MAG: Na+/H+ antiporter NhaA [Gammaproteobacteria bacterium]